MNRDFIETLVGFIVLIVAASFAFYASYINSFFEKKEKIEIFVKFTDIGGLKSGAPILMSGVKVGELSGIELDSDFIAIAQMKIDKKFKVPSDSSFEIQTSIFGGSTGISLVPGIEKKYMENGDTSTNSSPPMSLLTLASKFMGGGNTEKEKECEKIHVDDKNFVEVDVDELLNENDAGDAAKNNANAVVENNFVAA